MEIHTVAAEKKRYLDLLLLADEQESMIDRYLDRGELFVLTDGGKTRTVAVVTREGKGVCELKNLATAPLSQRRGYGAEMIEFLCSQYADSCRVMYVGTGDSPPDRAVLPILRLCGVPPDSALLYGQLRPSHLGSRAAAGRHGVS